jgi:hypothetical protein
VKEMEWVADISNKTYRMKALRLRNGEERVPCGATRDQ